MPSNNKDIKENSTDIMSGTILYHTTAFDIKKAIEPRTETTANGKQGKFIFSTHYLKKSLAFAIPYSERRSLMNGTLSDNQGEFLLLVDRENTLKRPIDSTIYTFYADQFEQIKAQDGTLINQWVSDKPLPLEQTLTYMKLKSYDDLMRLGLQILTIEPSMDELSQDDKEGFFKLSINGLTEKINSGEIQWLNKERDINPAPCFDIKNNNQESYNILPGFKK